MVWILKAVLNLIVLSCAIIFCESSQSTTEIVEEKVSKVTESKHKIVSECGAEETCVRFCCSNETACSDENFFDLSSLTQAKDLNKDYKILKGFISSRCKESHFTAEHNEWMFNKVSFQFNLKSVLKIRKFLVRMEL